MKVLVDKKPEESYLCLFAKVNWPTGFVTCKLGGECKGVNKCEHLKEIDNETND